MTNKLTVLSVALLAVALLGSCESDGEAEGQDSDAEPITRSIAGNSALGRAGSWSNNCLGDACARADADGNYRLSTEVLNSGLMWSNVPEADGTSVLMYSRYRLDEEITTTLVNINPSTHAIMDIWAHSNQNQSIDECALDPACSEALMGNFTEDVEATIVSQMDALLGDAWPSSRNPFDDIYVADSSDPLDVMHDHLQFVVTNETLTVLDNDGVQLTQASLSQLVLPIQLSSIALSSTQFSDSLAIEPTIPSGNLINLSVSISPSQPTTAPVNATVDATRSTSPNGELTFIHDVTSSVGQSSTFEGAAVSTTLEDPGRHIWVVTAMDDFGTRTQGYVITVLGGENDDPVFGGEGSCVTPLIELDANTQNLCEESQNGSSLGQCDVINASSVSLISSPSPCAQQQQNGGDLLGVCTILANEIRLFNYENPERPNYVETFEDKQMRLETQCTTIFLGDWSNTP
jgi:hypothetical protein